MDTNVEDTSDLPDWTGKQIELIWWYGHGVGNLPADVSTEDVITDEIKRVTGITINYDDSYGNGDNTFDVKLSLLAGTKDWPSIVTNPQLVKPFVEYDVIYDLTELVPKYCPTIMKLFPLDDPNFKAMWNNSYVNGGVEGKIYGIPISVGADYSLIKDKLGPIQDETKYLSAFQPPQDYHQTCIKIRDDVLKMLFPEAKTMDEIEEMYMEKGEFTREDVFDVPIKTKEDFFKMLRDIKALNLKEGNLPVYATYAACGLDNYPLAARLASHLYGWGRSADCFTYWDNETKEVKFTFREPELRELYRTFNQLIREGVIPQESLIDDDNAFKAKMNNGQYVVTYAEWRWPDDSILAEQGKPYRYRPLYLDIPINTNKYVQTISPPSCDVMLIFKDKVAEEDLPQLLRWIDYQFSEAFLKAQHWGPRGAGLFEEVNGKRKFKDKQLEDAMLYNNDPDTLMKYFLINGFFNPAYNVRRLQIRPFGATAYTPYMVYDDIKRDKSEALKFFKSGLVESYPVEMTMLPWIWNFPNTVPGVEKMWAARTTWEDALMKTLAATSDEEFEKLYDEFLKIAEDIGLTDETLELMNKDFKEQNKDFMDNLLN
jgi:ABC-type glycerol-3-phosphate transport system substrate-binding protein